MNLIIKGEKNKIFDELTTRLKFHKILFFKLQSSLNNIKNYYINNRYDPQLKFQIKNIFNETQNQTNISYHFILDEEEFFILELKRCGKDLNFIKSFFFDFYNFLLESTEVEEYFELKKWFLNTTKKWE